MVPLRSLISSVLMFALLATSFLGPLRQVGRANVPGNVDVPDATDEETGLQFRLSHRGDMPERKSATKLATACELSVSETENILERLPPMEVDSAGVQEFVLRERSLPPPRTGNIIDTAFPASVAVANETVSSGPLEVVRYSPEGGVASEPRGSVASIPRSAS